MINLRDCPLFHVLPQQGNFTIRTVKRVCPNYFDLYVATGNRKAFCNTCDSCDYSYFSQESNFSVSHQHILPETNFVSIIIWSSFCYIHHVYTYVCMVVCMYGCMYVSIYLSWMWVSVQVLIRWARVQ